MGIIKNNSKELQNVLDKLTEEDKKTIINEWNQDLHEEYNRGFRNGKNSKES